MKHPLKRSLPWVAAGIVAVCALALVLLNIGTARPAGATDLFGQGNTDKESPFIAFSGLGVGVQAGGQFTSIDIQDHDQHFDGISADGLVAGAHAEYLFALGRFRVGPYLEAGWSDVNTALSGAGDILRQDNYYGGGLKAGVVVWNASLISAHAGYERANWSSDVISGDINVDSYVVGAAVETLLTHNLSVGLSADYLIPANIEAAGQDVTDFLDESEQLRVMGRLTWRQ